MKTDGLSLRYMAGVLILVVCSFSHGCGRHAPSSEEISFEVCGRASVPRNLAILSNEVAAARQSGSGLSRERAETLAKAIAGVRLAEVSSANEPLAPLRAYESFVYASARMLRDSLPPDVLLGMLLDVRTRVLQERQHVDAWTGKGKVRPLGPRRETESAEGAPREMRVRGKDIRSAAWRTNILHEIDDGILVDLDELIERKVIPYYSVANCDTNIVGALRERFRLTFGRLPERRPLWWK